MDNPDFHPREIPTETAYGTPVKKRRPFLRFLLFLFILLLCAAIALTAAVFVVYEFAKDDLSMGDYASAQTRFELLGNFRDAASYAKYAEGRLLLEQEEYADARFCFSSLHGFLNSNALAEQADELHRLDHAYQSAEKELRSGDFVAAYLQLNAIREEDYKDTRALMDEALSALHAVMLSAGTWEEMQPVLEFFADIGYAPEGLFDDLSARVLSLSANGELSAAIDMLHHLESTQPPEDILALRNALLEQERITPDYSHYELVVPLNLIDSFNEDTTAFEFGMVYLYMALNNEIYRSLSAEPGMGSGEALVDRLVDTAVDGSWIADMLLSDLFPVYSENYSTVYYDFGYHPTSISLELSVNSDFTTRELPARVELLDDFCLDSIEFLNRNFLLGDSMSHRDKARVIYDWVCFYLNYDYSLDIHNPSIAIDETIGVCECYAALYNRMCNMLGIVTYAQVGDTTTDSDIAHIWTIQLDENGDLFYTDATWGDELSDSSIPYGSGDFMTDFLFYYADRDENFGTADEYFWQTSLWDTHLPYFEPEEIFAFSPFADVN